MVHKSRDPGSVERYGLPQGQVESAGIQQYGEINLTVGGVIIIGVLVGRPYIIIAV